MAKLLGRLGWHGQCACCCGPDGKDTIRAQEDRAWRAEAFLELADDPDTVGGGSRTADGACARWAVGRCGGVLEWRSPPDGCA